MLRKTRRRNPLLARGLRILLRKTTEDLEMNRGAVCAHTGVPVRFAWSEDDVYHPSAGREGIWICVRALLWGQRLSGFTGKLCVHPQCSGVTAMSCLIL